MSATRIWILTAFSVRPRKRLDPEVLLHPLEEAVRSPSAACRVLAIVVGRPMVIIGDEMERLLAGPSDDDLAKSGVIERIVGAPRTACGSRS